MSFRVVTTCKSTDTLDRHPCKNKVPYGEKCHMHRTSDVPNDKPTRDNFVDRDILPVLSVEQISSRINSSSLKPETKVKIIEMLKEKIFRDERFDASGIWDPEMYLKESTLISYLKMTRMISDYQYQEMMTESENRRIYHEANKKPVNMFKRDDTILVSNGIRSKKDFHRWLLKNHPDKISKDRFDRELYDSIYYQAELNGWI